MAGRLSRLRPASQPAWRKRQAFISTLPERLDDDLASTRGFRTMTFRLAVIADPHFHDVTFRPGSGSQPETAFRTLADTEESTRVFNESFAALPRLLDDIVARGIKIVVVAGDLTDDGQQSTTRAAVALLEDYSRRFGLRFFAALGNHDVYAIHGRHQSKRFLDPDGSHTLVTSDASLPCGASVSPQMYCGGYASVLQAMAGFGFFPRKDFLHWETPFGQDGGLDHRSFDIGSADRKTLRRMVDASYLVEPIDGLWLLSIDANVFEPRNGDLDPRAEQSFIDSTDAGWNSMLRNKPFILDWMKDVARRASVAGKKLVAFSHYPLLDPLNGTLTDEMALFGDTIFARRTPGTAVARAAAATGIKVHFSGHLHVNDTAFWQEGSDVLVNVSVPSMVGFPPAYKVVSLDEDSMHIETVRIYDVPGFDIASGAYLSEIEHSGAPLSPLLEATSHADFLSRHVAELVKRRYLPNEWPADLRGLVFRLALGDLEHLAVTAQPVAAQAFQLDETAVWQGWRAISFFEMTVDWYRLRNGRHLALDFIDPARIEAYRRLAAGFAAGTWPQESLQARLALFLRMMMNYVDAPPSLDFSVDLGNGRIRSRDADYLGRTERRQTGTA
ncbi:hypothetical protein ASD50_19705 [Mesorhizobium sp. Root552]|uniref:metallophosphoesterase family protein n=1 Tax=Mesorhizobium sp. Root552 TaxID=1736555 RepID=UPI000700014A|nr:metallophosphoesterase [Mesorhizobium sp. Root552]KQZ28389.1 hypothetical protein ASD50_19705 [Mesorhizobium sp. Root552]